jgi:hypothetical protein
MGDGSYSCVNVSINDVEVSKNIIPSEPTFDHSLTKHTLLVALLFPVPLVSYHPVPLV